MKECKVPPGGECTCFWRFSPVLLYFLLKDPPSDSWFFLGILLREFMTSITDLCLAQVIADWMGILDTPLTPSTPYQDSE